MKKSDKAKILKKLKDIIQEHNLYLACEDMGLSLGVYVEDTEERVGCIDYGNEVIIE